MPLFPLDKPLVTTWLALGIVEGNSFVLFDVSIVISFEAVALWGIKVTHKTQTGESFFPVGKKYS